jgi:hypothetical protein
MELVGTGPQVPPLVVTRPSVVGSGGSCGFLIFMLPQETNSEEAAGAMRRRAIQTAYYFNGKLPHLILIGKGVRFPDGRWIWVAGESLTPGLVEMLVRELFPRVKDAALSFTVLLSDPDVDQFEQEFGNGRTGT